MATWRAPRGGPRTWEFAGACASRTRNPVPLTLLEVRKHRLHVATEPFGVRVASSSNFGKHGINAEPQ